eukprot:1194480-Prorocentrum_minimum.AAC.4
MAAPSSLSVTSLISAPGKTSSMRRLKRSTSSKVSFGSVHTRIARITNIFSCDGANQNAFR